MASETAAPASFIDPKDVLSHIDQQSTAGDSSSAASNADPQNTDQTSSPKKKRKSWGQVLPKPTTNLPPRKRAKTAEEKAQRHYERVQRNRQAAHNSRMRKQDEMDRVVSENNRLKQDVQHYQDEIKRLQEEVALYRSSSTTVTPLTPPPDYLSNFSEHQQTSPEPSLTSGSSNTASSPPELADLASPRTLNDPSSDMKQFNDSHSAEMCTQQWTLNSPDISRNPGPSTATT